MTDRDPSDDLWHVLLPPGERLQKPLAVARLVAPLLGELPHDVATALRYGGGWLLRGVSRQVADQMVEILDEMGIPSRCMPQDECPLPVVRLVHAARVTSDGLHLESTRESRSVTIAEIGLSDFMIFGTVSPDDDNVREWEKAQSKKKGTRSAPDRAVDSVSELRRHLGPGLTPFSPIREAIQAVDLQDPLPILLLVPGDGLDVYQIEPGTMFPESGLVGQLNSLHNFIRFVDELMERLGAKKITPDARSAWDSKDFTGILVYKPEELENRASWLAAVAAGGHGEEHS